MTPGPTPVPEEAAAAMAAPLIHHRTAEFKALLRDTRARLAAAFRTKGEVAILTSSGSGGMEAAVLNTCAPGARVLVASAGRFGDRWAAIGKAYGLDVVHETCEPGGSFASGRFAELLRTRGPFQTAFVTGSESSTGAASDLKALGAATREAGVLLVADVITALAAMPVEMDAWGIDVAVAASQKAFGVPPGLAFVAAGPRGLEQIGAGGLPRFYFDLGRELSRQKDGETAFTPAIPQVAATCAVLKRLEGPALDAQIAATARRARAVRAAAKELRLPLLARDLAADSLSALVLPAGVDGAALVKGIDARTGLRLAGGQGDLKGKIVRIAHLGFVLEADTVAALAALEGALRGSSAAGGRIEPGRAVGAALAVFEEAGA
jgi:aspartate aminotransferase-like enzyme